ncbi:MAG: DUF302 domain-containing protein [Candidatus Acidiferrales bacterium]
MGTKQISVQRFSVISTSKFEDVVAKLAAGVGHPDVRAMFKNISTAKNYDEVEKIIQPGLGPTGLMEFFRFDHGDVLRKDHGEKAPRVMRFLIGNPLVMKRMVEHVPDAGSYAPVTILVDERADGVHISYDTMVSFLTPYGNAEALKVAKELDGKIEALMSNAAK